MSINPSRKLSANLRECLANAGLASLMTVARLKGEPSERALTGIRAIRDHLLKVEKELDDLKNGQNEILSILNQAQGGWKLVVYVGSSAAAVVGIAAVAFKTFWGPQ